MKRNILSVSITICIVFFISGCGGSRYDLTIAQFRTTIEGSGRLALIVQDQRPFILDGQKKPTYIGIHRSKYGIPKDAYTRTGGTVAEDIATIMTASLRASGFQVKPVFVAHTDSLDSSIAEIKSPEFDRIIVLTLEQFRSDSWVEVEFKWDINMSIYDGRGALIAQQKNNGVEEDLVQGIMRFVSGGQVQKAIAEKVGAILFELLTAHEMYNAMIFVSANVTDRPTQDKTILSQEMPGEKNETIRTLQEQLNNDEKTQLQFTAKQLFQNGVNDQESLDQLAEIIWKERNSNDRSVVDALCYLCKIFMKSKAPRYKTFFKNLGQEGKTKKLRRYADKTSGRLNPGTVEQFVPDDV